MIGVKQAETYVRGDSPSQNWRCCLLMQASKKDEKIDEPLQRDASFNRVFV
jgi:hypothetical protein